MPAAADSAWLGYVGHQHASGVFNLTAAHGLPTVTTDAGAIRLMASHVSRVVRVIPTDSAEIAQALNQLVCGPRQLCNAAECGRLQAAHAVSMFSATISAACGRFHGAT